ncbi:MAG: DUF2269 domain-containing protein [Paracoccaceae bacterium]
MTYSIFLFLHVVGACVLLGTGAGIAFFMVVANQSRKPDLVAHTAGIVVLADTVFTATAVVAQPITGYVLAQEAGWPVLEGWVLASLVLYAIAGLFWLPVVWIQIQLKRIAQAAALADQPLPNRYRRLYRIWFACGFPAFAAVLCIVWLMLTKPDLPF